MSTRTKEARSIAEKTVGFEPPDGRAYTVGDAIDLPRTNEAVPEEELTEEQRARLDMHHVLALIHGFNEMATKATTLGEKAYYRMARDAYEKRFNELGGKIDRGVEHTPVLVIPGHVPEIGFDARDIDLMRECVARYDGETPARTDSAWSPSPERLREWCDAAYELMMAELEESAYACSCGEKRYQGKPCTLCKMGALLDGADPSPYYLGRADALDEARSRRTEPARSEVKFDIEGDSPVRPVAWRAVGPWRADFRMAQSDARQGSETASLECQAAIVTAADAQWNAAIEAAAHALDDYTTELDNRGAWPEDFDDQEALRRIRTRKLATPTGSTE